MTPEERQILLADLCARLPYHVIVNYKGANVDLTQYIRSVKLENCKPYLRPMSSITDEETEELRRLGGILAHNLQRNTVAICAFAPEAYDWLNAHHFDYRGLIPVGLALEASSDMYKTE